MICYIVRYFLLEYRGSLRVFTGVPVADLYNFTEFGTALTTILPIFFLYLNTVIVTAGTFEP